MYQYYVGFSINFGIEFLPFVNDFFSSTRQIYQVVKISPRKQGKERIIESTDLHKREKERVKKK